MPAETDTWESLGRHFQLASTLFWNCRPSTIPYARKNLDTVPAGIVSPKTGGLSWTAPKTI